MSYHFKKAVRKQTSVLLALAGPSGSGKTYSAIRFARGLTDGRIAVIDTEAGRALHYADMFDFDHLDLKPPFSPTAYLEAIKQAEADGYKAIIIDSMSHEWAGDGGMQDMHDDAVERMSGGDSQKAERVNVGAWRDPKRDHKRMISGFLQSRSHLLFCLRAEEKIKMQKDEKGKMQIVPMGWQPICEKNFMYEMTASFMLSADRPGIPQPIKLQEQHKPFFDLGRHLDEQAGARLAEWSHGKANGKVGPTPGERLRAWVKEKGFEVAEVKAAIKQAGATSSADLTEDQLTAVQSQLEKLEVIL